MSSVRLVTVLLAFVLLSPPASIRAAESRDPAAVAVAQRTLDAMGGASGFEKLRTLKFEFLVVRDDVAVARWRHVWDRHDGRYRLEGKDKAGIQWVMLFNVQHRDQGRAWADGTELRGDELKGALERGYGRFINDTYWLLMPAKMLDPGVNLASEGEHKADGKTYDVVKLTFASVGLTPEDTYWAYVAKDTGLMDRWDFVLTGQQAERRSRYAWTDWTQVGPVRLALARSAPDGSLAIRFENVSGSTSADDAAFTAP